MTAGANRYILGSISEYLSDFLLSAFQPLPMPPVMQLCRRCIGVASHTRCFLHFHGTKVGLLPSEQVIPLDSNSDGIRDALKAL